MYKTVFKRVSDNSPVDLSKISEDDTGLYCNNEPYTPHSLHQRLIVTYYLNMPNIRRRYVILRWSELKNTQIWKGKKEQSNPNDSARFIGKTAVIKEDEIAKIENYMDTNKIENETLYDGLYAITTAFLNDYVKDILKISAGRWEIEKCFRIMKTDFESSPIYLQDEILIKAHFLIWFLSFALYRYLEVCSFSVHYEKSDENNSEESKQRE